MGKKIRAKTKKDKPRPKNKDGTIIKKKQVIKPEVQFNKILKTGTENDLENEGNVIYETSDNKIGFIFDKKKIKEINTKNSKRIEKVEHFVKNIYPHNCTLIEKHRSAVIFEIGIDVFDPELLFKKLEESKEELEIINWAISQVDLEDIFIKLTEKDL